MSARVARWFVLLCSFCLVFLLAITAVLYSCGIRVYAVKSNSMSPQFKVGDMLLVRQHDIHPKLGDIVTYRSAVNPRILISHRVVKSDGQRLTTKGDNLRISDPAIDHDRVVGTVIASLPGLGSWQQRIVTPVGLALTAYLPALCIIIVELYIYGRRSRSHYKYGHRTRSQFSYR